MSSLEAGNPLKERSVVSCFIFQYAESENAERAKPKVALFQRSNKVTTYQHLLAPISGTIEATDNTPLAAAWREIAEETTLTPISLVMTRQGKPFTFSDIKIRRKWTVHPFAFRLRSAVDEFHIRIDWEHEAWAWHDPASIFADNSFRGVPRLRESLRRVYFEADLGDYAGATLAAGLEKLRSDHQSGARKLATEALGVLRDVVAELHADTISPAVWWRYVRIAAWHVWKNGRESMGAAILNLLLGTLKEVEDACRERGLNPDSDANTCRPVVFETINSRIRARNADFATRAVSDALREHTQATFPDKLAEGASISILTLSESETVRKALSDLMVVAEFTLNIRVLESRPLFEGASLAGKLAEAACVAKSALPAHLVGSQSHISIWSDASAALASEDLDIVLIGADRISSLGDVSNKTGSVPAILSAKHVSPSATVVVLSETEKVSPPESLKAHVVEDNDPIQITRAWKADYNSEVVQKTGQQLSSVRVSDPAFESDWPLGTDAQVSVRNIFFEWIPSRLIDVYITESGRWTTDDIAEHSTSLAAEEARLFGDLAESWP